jgi:hypothetical protein
MYFTNTPTPNGFNTTKNTEKEGLPQRNHCFRSNFPTPSEANKEKWL